MESGMQINLDHFEDILSYQLLTNLSYAGIVIDHLKDEYFRRPGNKIVFKIVKKFVNEHNALPTSSEIKTYITSPEDISEFRKIVEVYKTLDKVVNIDELLKNSEQFIKEKGIYFATKELIQNYEKREIDGPEIVKTFEDVCNVSLFENLGLDYFNEVDKHIEQILEQNEFIPTGFKELDEKIGGGMLKGGRALYMFCGPVNVGKSIVLGNVAANVAMAGHTVLVISLEMSEAIYAKRTSACLTRIAFNELVNSTDELKSKLEDIRLTNPKSRIIFKEFPPSSITPANIKSFITRLIQRGIKPECIVLDYINLLKGQASQGTYEKVKEIAELVRALTYTFDCPIVSATQANREAYHGKEYGLDNTSESMGLPATADVQVNISQDENDKEMGLLKFNFAKNRFGPNFGKFQLKVDYDTLHLSDFTGYFTGNDNKSEVDEVDDLLEKMSIE